MHTKKFTDFLAKLVLAVLMSFSLVYPLTTTLMFPYKAYEVFGLVSVILIVYSILFINKLVSRISLSLILSALVLVLIYFITFGKIYYITDPIIWLNKYINEIESYKNDYIFFITLLFSIGLSLLVYVFTIKKFNFVIIALSGIVLFSTQWMFNYFVNKAYISFYTFILSILAYYLMHVYYKKSLQDSNDFVSPSGFILGIAPVCALVFVITNSMPVSSKPIEWKWMDEKINFVYNHFTDKGSDYGKGQTIGYFSLSSTGFGGENNTLGGDVRLDDTKVLEVRTPRSIYLRGRASDSYTGHSWTNRQTSLHSLDGKYISGT
ncbi:MAG: transglutaminase, partial [Bacillota bacterium]